MKRVLIAAICILAVFALAACGGATPEPAAAPDATPSPVLKAIDEDGADLGAAIEIPLGAENGRFIRFFTDNLGELNSKVGWDDAALTAAGITIEPRFVPEFGLYLSAEKEASADLRVYLSATEDWSDADNPPVELFITVTASAPSVMEVTSAGITDGVLSDEYGMRGSQQSGGIPTLSPPLTVTNIPKEAKALAVTVIDPDGGNWIHWLCCFAPEGPGTAELPENAGIDKANMLKQGINDFGAVGYGGPTPPGGVHGYVFTVYALADVPELGDGFDVEELNHQLATPGMVLAEASVTGTYAH